MKVDNTELRISRVEIIQRLFNDKGLVIKEQVETFLPEDLEPSIVGFKPKSLKKKK